MALERARPCSFCVLIVLEGRHLNAQILEEIELRNACKFWEVTASRKTLDEWVN